MAAAFMWMEFRRSHKHVDSQRAARSIAYYQIFRSRDFGELRYIQNVILLPTVKRC